MAYRDIQRALSGSVQLLNLGVPVAWENTNFDPDPVDTFVDETFIYDNEKVSLSKNTLDEITGIYQLSVYTKAGTGTATANDLADSICANYVHNDSIVSNAQNVVIVNSGRNAGRVEDGWYIVDVTITFKTDLLRV